jgi:hypothetical protein
LIRAIREKFNSEFKEETYKRFVDDLNSTFGFPIDFRVSETPIFLPNDLVDLLVKAAYEIADKVQSPDYLNISAKAIPPELNVPNEPEHPHFLQIDFAICKDENGNFIPQLIELQAFASLFFYQNLLSFKYQEYFDIPSYLVSFFNGLDRQSYYDLMRKVILEDKAPENVILLEIEPEKQKTRIDFSCTEARLGIRTVDLADIIKHGRKLYYKHDGVEIPVERIYNRVIFDELKNKDLNLNFNFKDDLDVEWVGHSNWFFRISKYTLPFLKSKYVPETNFLNSFKTIPDDLENYVLKPLFSFAGAGVKFDVKKEDIDLIPEEERDQFILMKKINYEPVIETLDIPAKAEIRMMFVWKENGFFLVNNLVRISKGKMMGVDFNKNKSWVGSSIAFHEPV